MVWWWLVWFVVAAVVSVALSPKSETRPPSGIDDIDVPTAEVGREIPVLFGTKFIKSANVVWYGDLKTIAIRKKGGKK